MVAVLPEQIYKRKVSSRGQTVLPPEVQEDLGIRPGDEIAFVKVDGAWVIRPSLSKENPYLKAVGALKEHTRLDVTTHDFLDEVRGPVEID